MSHANLGALKPVALRLTPAECGALIVRLIDSLEGGPEEAPAGAIVKAWDEEIAHRVAELAAGNVIAVPYEEVRAELRALIAGHDK